ncbi:MarR family transcriptional regulator, partial [Clostridium perfringens]
TLNVLNKVSNRFFKLLLEDLKDEELMFFDEVLNKMIKNLNNLKI